LRFQEIFFFEGRFQEILKEFFIIKKWCGIKIIKTFFNATKIVGIQLEFLTTYKMYVGIQKYKILMDSFIEWIL